MFVVEIAIQIVSTSVGSVFTASLHNSNDLISGMAGSIIGIGIDILILYYLYRQHVKAYLCRLMFITQTEYSHETLDEIPYCFE